MENASCWKARQKASRSRRKKRSSAGPSLGPGGAGCNEGSEPDSSIAMCFGFACMSKAVAVILSAVAEQTATKSKDPYASTLLSLNVERVKYLARFSSVRADRDPSTSRMLRFAKHPLHSG